MTINQFMTNDHRDCDSQFAELENIVDDSNFDGATSMFNEFYDHMIKHFEMEENIIFPKFNQCAGGGCNPTNVMIMEHDQMRVLFTQMKEAIEAKDKERFLGLSENLLFVMQQHNMKEEQIMYNLCDNNLNGEEIIEELKKL